MSFSITTAFVEQYSSNIHMLAQQKGSRLLSCVRMESQVGKNSFHERVGATSAQKRTVRHGDTPLMNTPHSRRRLSLVDYDWADLVDDLDKVRTLIDPANSYVQSGGFAMGRAIDDEIIASAFGNAYSGSDGSTTVTFPASQQIAVAASGLTITKLRAAKKILDQNEIDPSLTRFIACSAEQIEDLLASTEVTSSDFNTVKALVQGEVDSFMGFNFKRTERLGVDGSADRRVIAWAQPGLLVGLGQSPIGRISERADKNHSTQVYYSMSIGATRMEEEMVVEILCAE